MKTFLHKFVEIEKTEIPEKIKYEVQAFTVYRAVTDFIKGFSNNINIKNEAYYYRRWLKLRDNEKKQKRLTWIVKNIRRIGDELHNKYYDKKDLTLSLLFIYYSCKNLNLTMVKKSFVDSVIDKFSVNRYEKDKEFVLSICKEINISGIEDFFKITEDGTSLLYKYIEREYISPIFYINLADKVSAKNIDKANSNYKKFQKLSQAIRDLITNN